MQFLCKVLNCKSDNNLIRDFRLGVLSRVQKYSREKKKKTELMQSCRLGRGKCNLFAFWSGLILC